MRAVPRPYQSDRDVLKLVDLVSVVNAAGQHHWHVGDVWWGMYQNTVFDPREHIRLWEGDADELLGFGWFFPPCELGWVVHPRLWTTSFLDTQILAWGERHRRERFAADDPERFLLTTTLADDLPRIALLEAHGFTRDTLHMLHLQQTLDHALPVPQLPAGWTVRPVGGEDEWAERVVTHREVWHPSRVTLEAYRRLRQTPGYIPELDLVAVAPDGAFGAYCICWLDPVNQSGEFEPVGTRPAYRGRGLGKAVVLEGLRRLQQRGARTAVVYAVYNNQAAAKLYQSAGFQVTNQHVYFRKQLA